MATVEIFKKSYEVYIAISRFYSTRQLEKPLVGLYSQQGIFCKAGSHQGRASTHIY